MRVHYPDRIEVRRPRHLWKDTLVGIAAGVVGTAVMGEFWKVMAKIQSNGDGQDDGRADEGRAVDQRHDRMEDDGAPAGQDADEGGALDDISVVGPYHRDDESAPETAARVLYEKIRGEAPAEETRKSLATQVHWATGMGMGAAYGLLRGSRGNGMDLKGGILFGTGAWFANDEVLVPLLGLSEGPTAHETKVHVQALAAHVVYGIATAAAAQALDKMI